MKELDREDARKRPGVIVLRMTWKKACPQRMHSSGINGEGELSRQLANPGSPGKMAVKMECVMCMCLI